MSETCPRGPVEPLVSLRPEYSRLIQLAARIARREGMPDEDSWRWPSRVPVELYRQAQKANALAHDTCGDWATELRQIADAIVAANRKAMDDAMKANTGDNRLPQAARLID